MNWQHYQFNTYSLPKNVNTWCYDKYRAILLISLLYLLKGMKIEKYHHSRLTVKNKGKHKKIFIVRQLIEKRREFDDHFAICCFNTIYVTRRHFAVSDEKNYWIFWNKWASLLISSSVICILRVSNGQTKNMASNSFEPTKPTKVAIRPLFNIWGGSLWLEWWCQSWWTTKKWHKICIQY